MLSLLNNATSPHYCCSCGKIGSALCDRCNCDIITELIVQCFTCLRPVGRFGDICSTCKVYYSLGWYIGLHRQVLRELLARYKFKRVKSNAAILARLLHQAVPELPAGILVACVPTVKPHVRERGYAHAELLAKEFARLRGLTYDNPLRRATNTRQLGAARSVRLQQAKQAFFAKKAKAGLYLLIDDVSTTGATVNYAAKTLKDAGALGVWVATITREPLD